MGKGEGVNLTGTSLRGVPPFVFPESQDAHGLTILKAILYYLSTPSFIRHIYIYIFKYINIYLINHYLRTGAIGSGF